MARQAVGGGFPFGAIFLNEIAVRQAIAGSIYANATGASTVSGAGTCLGVATVSAFSGSSGAATIVGMASVLATGSVPAPTNTGRQAIAGGFPFPGLYVNESSTRQAIAGELYINSVGTPSGKATIIGVAAVSGTSFANIQAGTGIAAGVAFVNGQSPSSGNIVGISTAIGIGIGLPFLSTVSGGTPPPAQTTVSAASRLGIANGASTSAGTALTYRKWDKTQVALTNIQLEYWAGHCSATDPTYDEIALPNNVILRASVISGVNQATGIGAFNQAAATLTQATWVNAYNGVPGYVFNLFAETPTPTDIANAISAGNLVLSTDHLQLQAPGGWRILADPMTSVALAAGEHFCYQTEWTGTAGFLFPVNDTNSLVGTLGDARQVNNTSVYNKTWSSVQNITGPGGCPENIWGTSLVGAKMFTISGDSINAGKSASALGSTTATGNVNGVVSGPACFGDLGAVSFNNVSVPGSSSAHEAARNDALQRTLGCRFSLYVNDDMGANESGVTLAQLLADNRVHWGNLRAGCLDGNGWICADTLLPKTTSTDSWATLAAQTDVYGTTGTAAQYNTFLRANVFNPAIGDPNRSFDRHTVPYTFADNTPGWTYDVGKVLWPVNGLPTPNAVTLDGVHPKEPIFETEGVVMNSQRSTLYPGL